MFSPTSKSLAFLAAFMVVGCFAATVPVAQNFNFLGGLFDPIGQLLTAIGNLLTQSLNDLNTLVTGALGNVANILAVIGGQLNYLISLLTSLPSNLLVVVQGLIENVLTTLAQVSQNLLGRLAQAPTDSSKVLDALRGVISVQLEALKNLQQSLTDANREYIQTLQTQILGTLTQTATALCKVGQLVNPIQTSIENVLAQLPKCNQTDPICAAFNSYHDQLKEALKCLKP